MYAKYPGLGGGRAPPAEDPYQFRGQRGRRAPPPPHQPPAGYTPYGGSGGAGRGPYRGPPSGGGVGVPYEDPMDYLYGAAPPPPGPRRRGGGQLYAPPPPQRIHRGPASRAAKNQNIHPTVNGQAAKKAKLLEAIKKQSQSPQKPAGQVLQVIQKPKNINDEKVNSLKKEGLILKCAPDMFWCVFCDQNVTSIKDADDHSRNESHKTSRKEGNYRGLSQLDRVLLVPTPKMADPTVAVARREALDAIFGTQKLEFINQGIRLKDGKGSEAFWCAPCSIHLPSVSLVNEHIHNRRHTSNVSPQTTSAAAAGKTTSMDTGENLIDVGETETTKDGETEAAAEDEDKMETAESEDTTKKPIATLEDHLATNTASIVGLDSIVELVDPEGVVPRVYQCNLCHSLDVENSIIAHLTSYVHRLNFIKVKEPADADKFQSYTKETEWLLEKRAKELAADLPADLKWEVRMEKSTILDDAHKQPIQLPGGPNTSAPPPAAAAAKGKAVSAVAAEDSVPSVSTQTIVDQLNNFTIETDSQLDDVARMIAKLTDTVMIYKAAQGQDPRLVDVIRGRHLIGHSYGRILQRIDRVIADEAANLPELEPEQAEEEEEKLLEVKDAENKGGDEQEAAAAAQGEDAEMADEVDEKQLIEQLRAEEEERGTEEATKDAADVTTTTATT